MRRGTLRIPAWTLASAFGIAVALSACGSSEDPNSIDQQGGNNPGDPNNPNDPNNPAQPSQEEQIKQILDARKTDYGEALRTASLKLRDRLPDLAEIKQIEGAADNNAKKAAYEKLVDEMLDSPEFAGVMVKFWKDTFRTGQVGNPQNNVDRSAAANFAAQLTVENRSYMELFTAANGTCPTFDDQTGTFTAQDCPLPTNAQQGPTVGVLTDPGLLSAYFANMAFRRVRFIQETFACSKFPAEFSETPKPMGNGVYTGKFDFNSITGKQNNPQARIDFHDTQAVICANCHSTINHIAPLFINYADTGGLSNQVEVRVPIPGEPRATPADYLPAGEGLAWRLGKSLTDIQSLGAALAADPDVAKCAVNRVWNYAMSRGDIVNDLASVPDTVTAPYVTSFTGGGNKLKESMRAVFKSEDFTKF